MSLNSTVERLYVQIDLERLTSCVGNYRMIGHLSQGFLLQMARWERQGSFLQNAVANQNEA